MNSEQKPYHFKRLILELRNGQELILDALKEISPAIRSYKNVKPKLRDLEKILLDHFERQNRQTFDVLEKVVNIGGQIGSDAKFLLQDFKEIKVKTLIFIEDHPADMGDINPKNFVSDFRDFSSSLALRIEVEKSLLIPILESLTF
ncbi:MAG: hypothetical protein P9X22_08305 [Candidatus Zapsychrus exili]|nr:hypothetical protein [Candidatus Zapsychrus exili]